MHRDHTPYISRVRRSHQSSKVLMKHDPKGIGTHIIFQIKTCKNKNSEHRIERIENRVAPRGQVTVVIHSTYGRLKYT